MPEGSAWTAFGFVVGLAGGGALAAALRGKSVRAGRRCSACGASLSVWSRYPLLSWVGVHARCRACGRAAPRNHAGLELAVAAIALAAIFLAPTRTAIVLAAIGWVLMFGAILWLRRR